MRNTYRTKLNIQKAETSKELRKIARVFRKFYNLGLSFQDRVHNGLYRRDSEYTTDFNTCSLTSEQVIKFLFEVYEKTPSIKDVSTKVIRSAALTSHRKYSSSMKNKGECPKFMPRNAKTSYFNLVDTEVSANSVNIPNIGEIATLRKSPSAHSNLDKARVTFDGTDWWLSYQIPERVVANTPKVIRDNTTNGEACFTKSLKKYQNLLKKYNFSKAVYKRKCKACTKHNSSNSTTTLLSKKATATRDRMHAILGRLRDIRLYLLRKGYNNEKLLGI